MSRRIAAIHGNMIRYSTDEEMKLNDSFRIRRFRRIFTRYDKLEHCHCKLYFVCNDDSCNRVNSALFFHIKSRGRHLRPGRG